MPDEKRDLETAAVNEFSDALAGESAGRLRLLELREPPEPDALCDLDGRPLYVEVGHVYGTGSDAKVLLGRTGRSAATRDERMRSAMVSLDRRFIAPLNRLLREKAGKVYAAAPVWLLIRSAHPLWSLRDFRDHQSAIAVPSAHPFEQIWLLCGPRSSHGALRLA